MNNKYSQLKKYNFLKSLSFILLSILTVGGTILIIILLKYLNINYNINFFINLFLIISLPQIYSQLIKLFFTIHIDNKLDKMLLEIASNQNKDRDNVILKEYINDIEKRFNNLSIENRKKLLEYIKDDISSNYNKNISCDINNVVKSNQTKKNYTKKKTKSKY